MIVLASLPSAVSTYQLRAVDKFCGVSTPKCLTLLGTPAIRLGCVITPTVMKDLAWTVVMPSTTRFESEELYVSTKRFDLMNCCDH